MNHFEMLLTQLQNPISKLAVYTPWTILALFTNITKGRILKHLLKERWLIKMEGMQFIANSYLFEEFDRKFQQLFEGGLPNFYAADYFIFKNANPKHFEHLYLDGPQVLSLKHLEAGFVVWLSSKAFAIVAFMIEWLIRLLDYLVIKYIFTAFFKQASFKTVNDMRTKKITKAPTIRVHELDDLALFSTKTSPKLEIKPCSV